MTDVLEVVRRAENVPRNAWSDTPEGRATRERVFDDRLTPVTRNRFAWPALVAAVLVGIVITGLMVVAGRSDDPRAVEAGREAARPAVDDLAAGRWHASPGHPVPRQHAERTIVWTGKDIVVLAPGASGIDGAAYNTVSEQWRPISAPPLSNRVPLAAYWTGSRVLVWGAARSIGQMTVDEQVSALNQGALYDPVTDTWEAMAQRPFQARRRAVTAWTGTELYVFGGDACLDSFDCSEPLSGSPTGGSAFELRTGNWHAVQDPPVTLSYAASAIWNGEEVVVADPINGVVPSNAALTYDPRSETWTSIRPRDPRNLGGTPIRVGRRVVTFSLMPGLGAHVFDPRVGGWAVVEPTDVRFVCQPSAAPVRPGAFVSCGNTVRYLDLDRSAWRNVPSPPDAVALDQLVWTGESLVAFDVQGGTWTYRPAR